LTTHWFPKATSEPPPAPPAPHASVHLTAAEREAINVARIELYATQMFVCHHSHTLLKLLERTQ